MSNFGAPAYRAVSKTYIVFCRVIEDTSAMPTQSLKNIPGPTPLPLIGNIHKIGQENIHRVFYNWAKKFGDFFLIWFGPKPAIIISDFTLIQRLLKDRPHAFRRASKMEAVLREFGGLGLFSAEGTAWKRERTLVARGFGLGQIKAFYPDLMGMVDRLKDRLQRASTQSQSVDIQNDFMRFTVDVTSNLAFGYDPKSLINDQDPLQQHLQKVFPVLSHRLQTPIFYWRYFKFRKDREFDHAISEVHRIILELITNARKNLNGSPRTILEHLITAQDKGGFNDEELFGNIITIMLAGEDTTANTLAWMVYYLIENPDVFTKMREEVLQVLGANDTPPSFEDLDRLEWINAVAQEAMRLKPVAPFLFLENLQALELRDTHIPPNTLLATLFLTNYLDEKYFSDPLAFKPERWLENRPAAMVHDPSVFMPFGFGPRFCPGAMLAMTEIKLAAVMLSRHFRFEKGQGYAPKEAFHFTLMPKDLWVQVKKI